MSSKGEARRRYRGSELELEGMERRRENDQTPYICGFISVEALKNTIFNLTSGTTIGLTIENWLFPASSIEPASMDGRYISMPYTTDMAKRGAAFAAAAKTPSTEERIKELMDQKEDVEKLIVTLVAKHKKAVAVGMKKEATSLLIQFSRLKGSREVLETAIHNLEISLVSRDSNAINAKVARSVKEAATDMKNRIGPNHLELKDDVSTSIAELAVAREITDEVTEHLSKPFDTPANFDEEELIKELYSIGCATPDAVGIDVTPVNPTIPYPATAPKATGKTVTFVDPLLVPSPVRHSAPKRAGMLTT